MLEILPSLFIITPYHISLWKSRLFTVMVKKIRRKVKKVAMKASLVSMELEDLTEENKEQKIKLSKDFEDEFAFIEWKRQQEKKQREQESPEEEPEVPPDVPLDEDGRVESSNPPRTPNDLKKLYRSIAQKTHPDKIQDEEMNEIFKHAAEAVDEENWMLLIELAGELRLDIDFLSDETLEIVEQSIKQNQKQISIIKNSFSYMWCNQKDDKGKEIFKALFYKQFNINREEFEKWLKNKPTPSCQKS